jgi:hypothetical protein
MQHPNEVKIDMQNIKTTAASNIVITTLKPSRVPFDMVL